MSTTVLNDTAISIGPHVESDQAQPPRTTTMPDHSSPTEPARQRAISLFRYLAAIVELRTKMVRDFDSYENRFWFCDLPREPECFTPAWPDREEDEDGNWLRIERPLKPRLPHPPAVCESWIDRDRLEDATRQPVLRDEIADPARLDRNADGVDAANAEDGEQLRLADQPAVREAWQSYIEDEWISWSESCRRWERVQDAYRRLFSIYQMQRRRGEQFELVLGIGTLIWTTDSGHRIRRPIITGRAVIALEPVSRTITVSAAAEGANLRLEQDMLEVNERPPAADQQEYERQVARLDTPWDRPRVFEILRSWVHCLPCADAAFSELLMCPDHASKDAQIAFAPVLMLRKRSGQTLHAALQKTVTQLEDGIQIPVGIREICGDYGSYGHGESGEHARRPSSIPDEVLFPLPTNDEQKNIVYRLYGRPGILVQGPPGTGKSHTIANLISHFLAHGKRILVTSQTPRALKVLHAKIPESLQPLCVSLLGSDTGSLRNLEASVQGIIRTINVWNPSENGREIDEITRQRQAYLSELARLRQVERSVRETETIQHCIPGTSYQGSAQAIAQRVAQQQDEFAWLTDDPPENADIPLSLGDLEELAKLWGDSDLGLLESGLPDPASLPSPPALEQALAEYHAAEEAVSPFGDRSKQPRVLGLSRLVESDLASLKTTATRSTRSRSVRLRQRF